LGLGTPFQEARRGVGRAGVSNLANDPHHDASVWNTLINHQLRRFSIAIADLIAASVASFSVLLGGC